VKAGSAERRDSFFWTGIAVMAFLGLGFAGMLYLSVGGTRFTVVNESGVAIRDLKLTAVPSPPRQPWQLGGVKELAPGDMARVRFGTGTPFELRVEFTTSESRLAFDDVLYVDSDEARTSWWPGTIRIGRDFRLRRTD
jgi:hypothetical protein